MIKSAAERRLPDGWDRAAESVRSYDARVVLPTVLPMRAVVRIRLSRRVWIRFDAVKGQRTHGRAEGRVQIRVFDPAIGIQEEVTLPTDRQRVRRARIELQSGFVARAHDHVS